ncbi:MULTISPECIES: aldose 1-epimerase family protein [unclassified Nocardioides]|uniref:aldose 1-epimerase family protein n=1 Tax=unclassified Nocardioides TaxID=2615069 RepID=UPI0009F0E9F4|nr:MULTISPECIES: aldose 1-epimerase family protein [unclassified Nocardioides]GAW49523.1 aldose 1-epimerase [Nocardioides sp. PD653-B2]GAW54963.1 aldose 1-epimerase [Nocardioides sp. PD653]
MLAPSGDQYEISGGGYRAVVTESGAALRVLEYAGRPLVDGFGADEMSSGGRGQLLMPWPNRIRDGAYSFDGHDHQLALTEPSHRNASHGLVRWVAWSLEEHTAHSVSLTYRLMAQTGYPWTLDLHIVFDLSADGLTVTQTATNMSDKPAPYASGAHPYLTVGPGPVDGWELTLPASTRSLVDDRLLPVGRADVAGTPYDFRMARPIRDVAFNDAFTDLDRDAQGVATTLLTDPVSGHGVVLWVDSAHAWLQVFSADDVPGTARRSLAVEPMTAQADAFRSGEDLVTLAPTGADGDELSVCWGIRSQD